MRKFLIVLILFSISTLHAVESQQINQYLKMLADGRWQEVKSILPDLIVESPDDPGVLLLLGASIDDGFKAIDIFSRVVNTYPESEWADDAKWRIVQFYAVLGDTSKANIELDEFKRKYPSSPYLVPASDVVRSSVMLARSKNKANYTAPSVNSSSALSISKKEEKVAKAPETKLQMDKIPTKEESPAVEEPKITVLTRNSEQTITETPKPEAPKQEAPKQEVETPVKEEAKPVVTTFTATTADSQEEESKFYGLQVAIYSSKESAESEKQKYLRMRMRTEVLEKQVDGKNMYAVVIGNYTTKQGADAAKIIVKQQCNCDPVLIEK